MKIFTQFLQDYLDKKKRDAYLKAQGGPRRKAGAGYRRTLKKGNSREDVKMLQNAAQMYNPSGRLSARKFGQTLKQSDISLTKGQKSHVFKYGKHAPTLLEEDQINEERGSNFGNSDGSDRIYNIGGGSEFNDSQSQLSIR